MKETKHFCDYEDCNEDEREITAENGPVIRITVDAESTGSGMITDKHLLEGFRERAGSYPQTYHFHPGCWIEGIREIPELGKTEIAEGT